MLSPRRIAQFGLASASLILIASVSVLILGSSDGPQSTDQTTAVSVNHTQASSSIANFEAEIPQPTIASARH